MRTWILLALVACNGDETPTPDAGPLVLRLDTVAELTGDGAAFEGTYADPDGSVQPVPYVYGALLARGIAGQLFADPTDGSWQQLDTALVRGKGYAVPDALFFGTRTFPRQLELVRAEDYCVYMDGEIFLARQSHSFSVSCDDACFVDIASPGGAFHRILNGQRDMPPPTVTFDAAEAAYYPIRIATCQGTGAANLELRRFGAPVDAKLLRTRADGLRGGDQQGAQEPMLVELVPSARRIDDADPFTEGWTAVQPPAVGTRADGSLRLAGQLRVRERGPLKLDITPTSAHRLWIDHVAASTRDAWLSPIPQPTSVAPILEPGWHDIALDTMGPIAMTLNGQPIGAEDVRPVPMQVTQLERRFIPLQFPAGLREVSFAIDPAGAASPIATDVDVTLALSSSNWRNFELWLVPPDGVPVLLYRDSTSTRVGFATEQHWIRAVQLSPDQPARGTWKIRVQATQGTGVDLTFDRLSLTVHHRRGGATYPRRSTYVSPVFQLPESRRFRELRASAPAELAVRRCKLAATTCEDWITADELAAGKLVGGQRAQLRAVLDSDGDTPTIIDWLELVAD